MAPANTGKDNNNNIAVTNIAHTNNGNLCRVIPGALILSTVVMTLNIVKLITINGLYIQHICILDTVFNV